MSEIEKIREKKMKELEKKFSKAEPIEKPIEVTDGDFDKTIAENPKIVVDFWASWCMPCLMLAPVVEELSRKYAGIVTFAKLNVDENRKTAGKYDVMAIPTLLFFKNGKVVDQVVGNVSQEVLEAKIKKQFH